VNFLRGINKIFYCHTLFQMDFNSDIIYDIANLLSAFACLAIFIYYYRLPDKAFGYRLVLALSIFDFVFHVTNFIPRSQENSNWFYSWGIWLKDFAVCESSYWTAHMAFLVFKSFNRLDRKHNENKYSGFRIIYLLFPSLFLTLCTMLIDRRVRVSKYYGLFWSGPKILSILLTAFFYVRTSLLLRNYPTVLQHAVKGMIKFFALYPVIQAITLLQFSIKTMLTPEVAENLPRFFVVISDIMYNLVGFSNATLFFLQMRRNKNLANQEQEDDEEEITSSYINDSTSKFLRDE